MHGICKYCNKSTSLVYRHCYREADLQVVACSQLLDHYLHCNDPDSVVDKLDEKRLIVRDRISFDVFTILLFFLALSNPTNRAYFRPRRSKIMFRKNLILKSSKDQLSSRLNRKQSPKTHFDNISWSYWVF